MAPLIFKTSRLILVDSLDKCWLVLGKFNAPSVIHITIQVLFLVKYLNNLCCYIREKACKIFFTNLFSRIFLKIFQIEGKPRNLKLLLRIWKRLMTIYPSEESTWSRSATAKRLKSTALRVCQLSFTLKMEFLSFIWVKWFLDDFKPILGL